MASSRYSTAPSFTTMHGPQKRTVDCYFNLFERPRPLRCCNPDRPSTGSSEATEINWPTRQSSLPHDVLPYFTRHRPLTPTAFLYTPEHYVQANDERHREMHATCEEEEDDGDEMTADLESTTTTSVPLREPISQTRLDAPLPSSPPLDSPPTTPNLHSTLTQTSNVSTTTTTNNIEETPTTTTTTTTASSLPPQCPVHHSPTTCLYCRTTPPITINTTTHTPPPYPSIIHPPPLCRVQHPSHYHSTADGPVFLNSRRHQQEEQQYPTCLLKNDFPAPPSIFPPRCGGGLTVTSPRTVLRGFYREEVRTRIGKVRERIGFCRFCFCRWGRGMGMGMKMKIEMKSGGGGDCFSCFSSCVSPSSRSRSRRMDEEDRNGDGDRDGDEDEAARVGRMHGIRGRNRNLTTPTPTTTTTMRMGMRRMGSVRTMELD